MKKRLTDLLAGVGVVARAGAADADIESLEYDSRKVGAGCCFFALRGTNADGHDFIRQAVDAGAAAVVCSRLPEFPDEPGGRCAFVAVEDADEAMGLMASAFYDHPSRQLRVVGVTGTNGKTTVATLLYDLFRRLGHRAGLISTVVYKIDGREQPSTHTTPDALRLHGMMREMVDCGCEYCFMECSSHAIVQRRIAGISFAGGLFTNITHDHLDYHGTFAEYIRAKKLFFDRLPEDAFALVNADDRNGGVMLQNTAARRFTLSMRSMADFRCQVVEMRVDGMELRIGDISAWVQFIGRFNACNLLTVYGAAVLLGVEPQQALVGISALRPVEGRLSFVTAGDGTTAIVDYAHTPDALENVIRTINEIREGTARRLTVVCGCGGERDRTKRPVMARIAVQGADRAIFTSDNPRSEAAEDILRDMEAGVASGDRYLKIVDRSEAIKTAVMLSERGDIILLAGKGHEHYQIVGTERLPFNDRECVEGWFAQLGR